MLSLANIQAMISTEPQSLTLCGECGVSELEVIKNLGRKLQHPSYVRFGQMQRGNSLSGWEDLSLANGYPSLVMFYTELASQFPNEEWGDILEEYLGQIVKIVKKGKFKDYSLFRGLAGVCYALSCVPKIGVLGGEILQNLNEVLIDAIKKEMHSIKNSFSFAKLNLYEGIVGIGVYLLHQLHISVLQNALMEVLHFLIDHLQNFEREKYPLGLANGMSGVLAFLSLCMLNGVKIDHQMEICLRIAQRIQEQVISLNGWPISKEPDLLETRSVGWFEDKCGILRSLYLAGLATKNSKLMEYAQFCFSYLFDFKEKKDLLSELPVYNYLYLSARRMAKDTKDLHLWGLSTKLRQKMIDFFNHATFNKAEIGQLDVSFTVGLIGIALSLLSSRYPTKCKWESLFLI